MNRRTHTLDYQPDSEKEAGYNNMNFLLNASADHTCDCRRESDPASNTFADESFERFIGRHALSYCSVFNALTGDKATQYANAALTRLYWFQDCCSMGGSYRTLVMVTTWPVVRLKTETDLRDELAACDQLMAAIKREASLLAQQR